jgi:hypothetical protein
MRVSFASRLTGPISLSAIGSTLELPLYRFATDRPRSDRLRKVAAKSLK